MKTPAIIDAHNLFITELFHIGIIGAISLFLSCALTVLKLLKISYYHKNNLDEKMYFEYTTAGLIGLLTHRLTCSFESVPTLWFLLGFSLLIIENNYSVLKKNRAKFDSSSS